MANLREWRGWRRCVTLIGLIGLIGAPASATTLVLEGSDASTFHGAQEGGSTYTQQLIAFLREGSSKPVAVFTSSPGLLPTAPAGSVVYVSDLSGLSTSEYSAVYVASPGGCCSQNLSGASAFAAELGAFYADGGSVAIQNYTGGDWSFISSKLATPPAGAVRGYDTGGGGPTCTDAEVFNAEGLGKGFTQPPALGCWEHQAYDNAYFVDSLGFLSLVDSDPAYGFATGGSAFLAFGGALGDPGCTDPEGCEEEGGDGEGGGGGEGGGVPEPGLLSLLAIGIGAGIRRRRRH